MESSKILLAELILEAYELLCRLRMLETLHALADALLER
jgi:hypothetical protein